MAVSPDKKFGSNKEPDKNRTAIALEYNPNESDAPRVVATGKGVLAD